MVADFTLSPSGLTEFVRIIEVVVTVWFIWRLVEPFSLTLVTRQEERRLEEARQWDAWHEQQQLLRAMKAHLDEDRRSKMTPEEARQDASQALIDLLSNFSLKPMVLPATLPPTHSRIARNKGLPKAAMRERREPRFYP